LDSEEIHTWVRLLDAYGERATTEIFDRVFDPERIWEREPYPGAPEVLRAMQEEMDVHFVTRNEPGIGPHLKPWLREHFGPEVGLTVTRGEKLDILRGLDAFGLIDDRPETLVRVADARLWAATKLQPWNRDLVAARGDVHGFADWREVPELLRSLPRRSPRQRPAGGPGGPLQVNGDPWLGV
ncbi:MAG: hypothetical protein M3151_08895, partial [Actinomycetota bacterium]|nr:hypothetical protein [Actinomycetota bacterium]